MKIVSAKEITKTVSGLCLKSNLILRKDVKCSLKGALSSENSSCAKDVLRAILENAEEAEKEKLAICQDTGLPIVFIEVGQGVAVKGDLKKAVLKGIADGYKKGYFRESVVPDPLSRGKSGFQGAVIHFDLVKGNHIKIALLPKGFGCENKSQLKMFKPTAEVGEIKKFIIETVRSAGPDACPPYVLGVGIGGTADYACLLAKKALLRKVTKSPSHQVTSKIERELLLEINKLNIGPMGLGGKTTALAVNIEKAVTHIAGLPVAVNISCHALRSASAVI